jgi:hypothetical protein
MKGSIALLRHVIYPSRLTTLLIQEYTQRTRAEKSIKVLKPTPDEVMRQDPCGEAKGKKKCEDGAQYGFLASSSILLEFDVPMRTLVNLSNKKTLATHARSS